MNERDGPAGPPGRDPTARDGDPREGGFATRQLHAGQEPDAATGARAVPIYATSSYLFDSAAHAEAIFAGDDDGNQYGRVDNPTVRVFADRLASLEGGAAGVAFSSGQAAATATMLGLGRPGGEWILSDNLFGGTLQVARKVLEPYDCRVRFVPPTPEAVREAAGPDTVGVWVETIANPSGLVPDLPALAEVAHAAGAPLVVDNTFGCGGYLCRPIEHGADAVVHSATKWIGGHGVLLAGAVVDAGRFDWGADASRFAAFAKRDGRGRSYLDRRPEAPLAARVQDLGLSVMGMTLAPHSAFLALQGLETLSLRVQRSCDGALELARRLRGMPGVQNTVYPGLDDHPSHAVARRVLRHGFGGVLGVRFASEAHARGALDRLRLVSHLANIGDAKTVAIHPWTTTHASPTDAEKRAAGVTPEMVRLSVGLEEVDDLEADLRQAIHGAAREVETAVGEAR